MKKPLISVILPVYNCEKYIGEAISSILNQKFDDFEIIIINDGSTDGTEKEILSFSDCRIKYIKQENKGLSKTLNYGISKALGKYIARMDADDISMPDRFERQIEVFQKNTEVGIVSSNVEYINEVGGTIGLSLSYTDERLILKALEKGNVIFHPTVMFKKDVFEMVGGYDEIIGCYFEDYLLWLEMLKITRIVIMRKSFLKYRILSNSLSRSKPSGMVDVERKVALAGGYYEELYSDFGSALNTKKCIEKSEVTTYRPRFHLFFTIVKNCFGYIREY